MHLLLKLSDTLITKPAKNGESNIKIKDYKVETNDLGIGHKTSRHILLIHNTNEYTWKSDPEQKYIAVDIINTKCINNPYSTYI